MFRLFKPLSVVIVLALAASGLFAAISPSQAQSTSTPTVAPSAAATSSAEGEKDDSDELPIIVTVYGKVVSIDATAIKIGSTIIKIPVGVALPPTIVIDATVTIRANLRNDDSFSLLTIGMGYPTPTPTPTKAATGTPAATLPATLPATLQATHPATQSATIAATMSATASETPEPSATFIAGCQTPPQGQNLALFVSAAYNVSYRQIIILHCKGFTFGEIARAFLIVITSEDEDKSTTVDIVLELRRNGKHWSEIIIVIGVDPDPESIIIVIVGGGTKVTIVRDCNLHKKQPFCLTVISNGGGGNSGGGGNGKDKGKGKGGDGEGDED